MFSAEVIAAIEASFRGTYIGKYVSIPRLFMATAKPCVTTAGELVRKFSHYSDIALEGPVVITKNGRPCNVLNSIDEYERLKTRDQQAFLAADTPERFLADLAALASDERD